MISPVILEQIGDSKRDVFQGVASSLGARTFNSSKPLSSTTYVIAMLPRTGSTALCSVLTQTGAFGFPGEYLNPRGPIQHWAGTFASQDASEYFDRIRRERATENGIFGLKTTYDDFKPLLDSSSVGPLLGDVRFIYLRRSDVLGQAISEYIAEETGIWHRDADGRPLHLDTRADRAEVAFDEARIVEIVERFIRMQQSWERFFALHAITPLRISYEWFSSDTATVVERLAAHIGVDWRGEVSLSDSLTSKMADSRNADWAARFRSKHPL